MLNLPNRCCKSAFQMRSPSTVQQASTPVVKKAQTYLPSVQGEGEAESPSSPRTTRLPDERTCFHFCLPSVLMQSSTRSASSTLVTKIRSPHTTGEAPPRPGSSNFQAMFSLLVH